LCGQLFSHWVFEGEGAFPQHCSGRLGAECEVAVMLGFDISPRDDPFTRQDVGPAVAASCAAIEVVEDRYVDYPTMDTPTLIADDFLNLGVVLGAPRARWTCRWASWASIADSNRGHCRSVRFSAPARSRLRMP
jgi:2-keto-4-pentenoate hydratase